MALANMTQEETNTENRNTCKRIAESLEAYSDGLMYRCPECGEEFYMNENAGDKYCCPSCRAVFAIEEYEQLSIWDYMNDALDIRFVVSSRKEILAVKVLVAFGGPNIWIDTESRAVELYWWTDRASYPISTSAANALDAWAEEYWECM